MSHKFDPLDVRFKPVGSPSETQIGGLKRRKKPKKWNTEVGGPGQYNTTRYAVSSQNRGTKAFTFAGR